MSAQASSETGGSSAAAAAEAETTLVPEEEQSKLAEETEHNDSVQPGEEKIEETRIDQQSKVNAADIS
eukprot:Seg798.6 transcript_id=Seg798.6/GoldUCD/mRNA.D3Y31 product="hypothetical protein" protein_id=Seg798.6/GoldUCD/D3Y31